MDMNVKSRLYEGIAVSITVSGTETWRKAVVEKKRLNEMEMRCMRSMC